MGLKSGEECIKMSAIKNLAKKKSFIVEFYIKVVLFKA